MHDLLEARHHLLHAGDIHRLGVLAQARGDYGEAARQYQRSLDTSLLDQPDRADDSTA